MLTGIGVALGLDRSAVISGLRLASAAWLAFAIASIWHVENAYWAAMPIWVITQPYRGLMLERGLFRILGTLVGAAVGFALLRGVADPLVVFATLGLWVAINAATTKLLRGVFGYATTMAGMTAAVVVIPAILQPEHGGELAVARVICTLIGVSVVTLVTGIWTPPSPRQTFYRQVRQLGFDAIAYAVMLLKGAPTQAVIAGEHTMLSAMAELQSNASLVSAGSVEGYRRLAHVDDLIVAALNLMAAARVGNHHLRVDGMLWGLPPAEVTRRAEALPNAVSRPDAERRAATFGLGNRLAEAFDQLAVALQAFDGETAGADARSFGRKATWLAPDRDSVLAAEIGLLAGGATFAACLLGHASGWAAGNLAALGVCIFAMVLGSLPVPRRIAPLMLQGTAAGIVVALLYRFLIQPHITTVPLLLLSVAPFLLVGGLARVSKRFAGPALDANMVFLLAGQAVLPPVTDAGAILNGAAAILLAAGVVCSGLLLLPDGRERRTRGARMAIQADLLRLVDRQVALDPAERVRETSRQILRLSRHLAKATALGQQAGVSLLATLNLGEAIGRLRALAERDDISAELRVALDDALRRLQTMRDAPVSVADELDQRGQAAGDPRAADVLRDVAAGLRASSGVFRHGATMVAEPVRADAA